MELFHPGSGHFCSLLQFLHHIGVCIMLIKARRRLAWLVGTSLVLLLVGVSGCGGGRQSEQQSLDEWFKNNPKAKRDTLAKFAGRVTVDGQPPAKDQKLFVILNDPDH